MEPGEVTHDHVRQFERLYDDFPVKLGGFSLGTLKEGLQLEARFCPADQTNLQDPSKRMQFLAKSVIEAAGTDGVLPPPYRE